MLEAVRAYIVAEVIALLHHLADIEVVVGLLTVSEEVVYDPESVVGIEFSADGSHS